MILIRKKCKVRKSFVRGEIRCEIMGEIKGFWIVRLLSLKGKEFIENLWIMVGIVFSSL